MKKAHLNETRFFLLLLLFLLFLPKITLGMKKQLLLFLLLAITFSVSAQFRVGPDVVYLKDGSVIRGTIRFAEPDSTLFVDTNYGCTFVYSKSEVERFELKEQIPYKRGKGLLFRSSLSGGMLVKWKDSGYQDEWYDINNSNKSQFDGIHMDVSLGLAYQVCSWYAVGLDFSHFFHFADCVLNASAVQIDQRFYLLRKQVSPYIDLKAGCSFNLNANKPSGIWFYENLYEYENVGFTGAVDLGVSLKNFDMAFCLTLSPYEKIDYFNVHEYHDDYGYYADYYGCRKYLLFGFSIRVGYSFQIN